MTQPLELKGRDKTALILFGAQREDGVVEAIDAYAQRDFRKGTVFFAGKSKFILRTGIKRGFHSPALEAVIKRRAIKKITVYRLEAA